MKFTYDRTIKMGELKLNIVKDDKDDIYFERPIDYRNYNVIKLISEICLDSSNLNNISAFYSRGTTKEYYYLTRIENTKTLKHIIEKRMDLTEAEINYILYQMLLGVQTLHNNNIIHSNLNLQNFSINKNILVKVNNYDHAFDIDNIVKYQIDPQSIFVAPEMYSFKNVDFYSDIYSIGKILEQLTSHQKVETRVQFAHIIDKCCAFDFKVRFQSVDEILELVEAYEIPFFPPQIEQMQKAKQLGLTEQQIKKFAKPNLNSRQMGVIKHALDEGIDETVIDLMVNPMYSSRQMFQIMKGSEDGLNLQTIKKFAKEFYTPEEMAIYRTGLNHGFTQKEIFERIKLYKLFSETSTLDDEQLKVIRFAFYNNISRERLSVLLNDSLSTEEMQKIVQIILKK